MGTFLHLSLGAKHGIYGKEGFGRNSGRFHIDVMINTTSFSIDDDVVLMGRSGWCKMRTVFTLI